MSATVDPRSRNAESEYYYRRKLSVRELLPAIGIGVAAGLAAFYVASVMFQRTPLRLERRPSSARPNGIGGVGGVGVVSRARG